MDLGEYFSKSFSNMFKGKIYWPTFLVSLIIGVIAAIIGVIVAVVTIGSAGVTALMNLNTAMMAGNYAGLLTLIGGMIIGFIILSLIIGYFACVGYVFIFKKIKANELNSNEEMFNNFSSSFATGFKLFLAMIVVYIAIGIVSVIFWLLFLIPILGWILMILFCIFLMLYMPVLMFSVAGTIAEGGSFGSALAKGFLLPFQKPILVIYTLVLLIVYGVMYFVLMLLGLIPVLGFLVMLFGMPALFIYIITITYNIAKE